MNVHQIQTPELYVRYMQENQQQIDRLFKELLTSVTNYFRDPKFRESLSGHLACISHQRS